MCPDLSQRGPIIASLYTPDMQASERFYIEALGFVRTGQWIEDGTLKWMELKHPTLASRPIPAAPLTLWFFANPLKGQDRLAFSGLLYFMVADVSAYAQTLSDAVAIDWGPEVMPYGLLELGLRDNNGYRLVFAQEMDGGAHDQPV